MIRNILTILFLVSNTPLTVASDHVDGPVTAANAVADLTDLYAFPTPDQQGSLSVVMNTYPLVSKSSHFSDKVSYNIILRRADRAGSGTDEHFETSDEVVITCTFNTPAVTADHMATCRTPNGLSAEAKYNEIKPKQPGDDFHVYAGMRSDPFFFDAGFTKDLTLKGKVDDKSKGGSNIMDHANVMSIAMDLDLKKLFKGNPPAMVAVSAESMGKDTPDSEPHRVDRVGRPEITNITMFPHGSDKDNRDIYNLQKPFAVSADKQAEYEARIAKNLAFYDRTDGHKDWPDAERKQFARILANDFIVVDVTKPCTNAGYLDIEKSMIAHKPHTSCGGRRPNDETMSTIYSTYIGGIDGKTISDGTHPFRMAPTTFPYLAEPDLTLTGRFIDMIKRFFKSRIAQTQTAAPDNSDEDQHPTDTGTTPAQ